MCLGVLLWPRSLDLPFSRTQGPHSATDGPAERGRTDHFTYNTSIVISQITISIQPQSGALPILHFTGHILIQAWLCGFASPAAITGQAEHWQGIYLQVFMSCPRSKEYAAAKANQNQINTAASEIDCY